MTQECKCYIDTIEDSGEDGDGEYRIVQCPLCKAAPDLLEALQKIVGEYIANPNTPYEFVVCITPEGIPDYWQEARAAIAKATA